MRRLLAGLLLLVVGCSDDSSGPGDDDPVDIEGTWTFGAEVSSSEFSLTCTATGTALIEQSGSQFTGQIVNSTGSCTGPGGTLTFNPNGAIGGGTIDDDNVAFDDNFCEYSGVATGDPINEVDGDATCIFVIDGEEVEMVGTWQMDR